MQSVSSTEELRNAIQLLEVERGIKGRQLKDQFYVTYESLRPINVLRNTLKEISSSRYLIDNISGTALGMAGGFLTKKIFVGRSGSALRKLIGSILNFGLTNIFSKNSETIRAFSQSLLHYFFRKKDKIQ